MIQTLKKLQASHVLSSQESYELMKVLLHGQSPPEQIGAFLMALQFQKPTAALLTGFIECILEQALPCHLSSQPLENIIDVCGTGGDSQGTFNISTTVAFIVAAGGVACAKHGNRAVSSRSGSFDVLEALQIPKASHSNEAEQMIANFGLTFLFAPDYHPVLKNLAAVRKNLGIRTILNALGPLLNPARVRRHVIGVYSKDLLEPAAETLRDLGSVQAFIVHGEDGSDELTLCADNIVTELREGNISTFRLAPEDLGFERACVSDLKGGSPIENAQILQNILAGTEYGPKKDIVLLNAAAAFVVADKVRNLHEGVELAKTVIESKLALKLLNRMVQSNQSQKVSGL